MSSSALAGCLFLGVLTLVSSAGDGANQSTPMTRSEFLRTLLDGYDSRVPPNFHEDKPTIVDCDLYINSVDSISETTMDYVLTIFLRQQWKDDRLSYGHLINASDITMDAKIIESLWVPDIFFPNEKHAYFHEVTIPNRMMRLKKDGTVFYSARISLTLSCPMRLHKFPMDSQVCSMQMESYAYTTDKMVLKWRSAQPIEVSNNLELPQFRLENYTSKDCTKKYMTGFFPCLQVDFFLERDVGYYMIQTYIPSALIVILSWVSFWINIDAVPARISLGVLTILTMTTQSSGSRQSLPRVSYVKAIDVWMSMCLVFVFAALLEFAIVNVLSRREIKRMVTIRNKRDKSDREALEMINGEKKVHEKTFVIDPLGKQKARLVDKVARKLFPSVFVIFNIVYWVTYYVWKGVVHVV